MGEPLTLAEVKADVLSVFAGTRTYFDPSGIQDEVIAALGSGEYDIVNAQMPNKVGKTTVAANILKNIIWPADKRVFSDPIFKSWPYKDRDGNPLKRMRIVGTKENIAEAGPIYAEIKKWWPAGRYTPHKHQHSYPKEYKTDTGWTIDVLSFEQKPTEHEGPLIALIWCDEPAKPDILGAMMSRFATESGGVLLLTQTPINAGPMLDAIDDLKAQGTRVKTLKCSIEDDDKETGKWNRNKTRRGLRSHEEIVRYSSTIPSNQREARLKGETSHASGKVFDMFDVNIHVKEFDINSDYFRKSNLYMVMDPHEKYYPFIQWWAITPDECFICWNEWPTFKTLGNNYYDAVRKEAICYERPSDIAEYMKIFDGSQFGLSAPRRTIDPRFAKGTEMSWSKDTQGIIEEYARHGIKFEMPPFESIQQQRVVLQDLIHYDLGMAKRPRLYILPHCVNTIRAFERHFWEDDDGKEKEAERYKDAIDCPRYVLALAGGVVYREPITRKKGEVVKGDMELYQEQIKRRG